jgi:hypothetical protein
MRQSPIMSLFWGGKPMEEKIHNYQTDNLSQDKGRKLERLALPGEDVTVQDSSKQQQKRHSPLSVEIYTKTPEKRVLKTPARPSPLLKTIGDLYIAKEVLHAHIEGLQDEIQELRDKEERRLQQARDSYTRQRQQNLEEYKDKRAEYMREYRKRKKQQVPPPTE